MGSQPAPICAASLHCCAGVTGLGLAKSRSGIPSLLSCASCARCADSQAPPPNGLVVCRGAGPGLCPIQLTTCCQYGRHLQVPPNGLVVYTGTVMTDDGKEKKMNIDFEPFKPINTSL